MSLETLIEDIAMARQLLRSLLHHAIVNDKLSSQQSTSAQKADVIDEVLCSASAALSELVQGSSSSFVPPRNAPLNESARVSEQTVPENPEPDSDVLDRLPEGTTHLNVTQVEIHMLKRDDAPQWNIYRQGMWVPLGDEDIEPTCTIQVGHVTMAIMGMLRFAFKHCAPFLVLEVIAELARTYAVTDSGIMISEMPANNDEPAKIIFTRTLAEFRGEFSVVIDCETNAISIKQLQRDREWRPINKTEMEIQTVAVSKLVLLLNAEPQRKSTGDWETLNDFYNRL